jgi:hypothetical protein
MTPKVKVIAKATALDQNITLVVPITCAPAPR